MDAPRIIAHRTCPYDAVENSRAGVREAAVQGADGVEIDLRLSLDGVPVLMHDRTMWRMVGPMLPVEILPAFVLRRLRLKGSRETIPTLSEIFGALPAGMELAVDVKTGRAVKALIEETRRRGLESRVLLWCTSPRWVAYAVRHAPAIETAYLSGARGASGKRRFLRKAVELGAKAVSAHWDAIDAGFVASAHERGLRIYAWDQYNTLLPAKLTSGMDGLITDFPRRAREAYEKL